MDTIDLLHMPSKARFDTWRAITEPFFDVGLGSAAAEDFTCRVGMVSWGEGHLMIQTEVSGHRYERTDRHAARSGFDHIAFQLYRSGSFSGRYQDCDIAVQAGDINIVDFTKPLVKESLDQSDVNLILPRDLVIRRLPNVRHGSVLATDRGLGRLAATHLEQMIACAGQMSPDDAGNASDSFLILLSGGNFQETSESVVAFARSTVRSAAEAFMRKNMVCPELPIEAIARHCGVSRATLYRVFENEGGVRARLMRLRLEAARALLAQNRVLPIWEAALSCGLADPSSFTRRFRAAFAMTPSDVQASGWECERPERLTPAGWIETVRHLRAAALEISR